MIFVENKSKLQIKQAKLKRRLVNISHLISQKKKLILVVKMN